MKYTPEPPVHRTFLRGGLPLWLPISAVALLGITGCSNSNQNQGNKSTLLLARTGSGSGTVVSMPDGISCGTQCSLALTTGTEITLTATPGAGSDFVGWGGDCSNSGSATTCKLTLGGTQQASARFEYNPLGTRICSADIAWKEMSGEARVEPKIRPLSSCGK